MVPLNPKSAANKAVADFNIHKYVKGKIKSLLVKQGI
jgi:hypothetical protein